MCAVPCLCVCVCVRFDMNSYTKLDSFAEIEPHSWTMKEKNSNPMYERNRGRKRETEKIKEEMGWNAAIQEKM